MKRAVLALTLVLLLSSVCLMELANARTLGGINDRPTVKIFSPVNGTSTNRAVLNFTVPREQEWFPGRMLVSFAYEIDGNLCRSLEVNHDLIPSAYNYTVCLENLTEGLHRLRVDLTYTEVVMEHHHIKYDPKTTSSSNVTFTVDTTAPKIIIHPVSTQENNSTIAFTTNEPTMWMGYSLDGRANVTISGNTTIPDLPKGDHTLQVYAADNAGNISASETIQFNTQPFPLALIAIVLATLAIAVGAGLLFYLKKHRRSKL